MAIAITIFGVAFTAFSIWLIVEIVNHHKQWAKRTLAAVLYVASLAPLFLLEAQVPIESNSPVADACRIYAIPARIIYQEGSQLFRDAFDWYRNLLR